MSLKYTLVENLLTPAVDDYTAQVQQVKTHDRNSIIDKMLKRGTMLTKTDILAVLNLYDETIIEIVSDGDGVNTDIVKIYPSMVGVFIGATDSYDPKRHTVKTNMNAGKAIREATNSIKTEKIITGDILPNILEVKDSVSQTTNDQLTPNGVLEIAGNRLKIDGEADQVGIFFVSEADNTIYKVATIVDNKPARLIVMIPALPKGYYSVQVKTAYSGGGTLLKMARIGVFNKPLQVV